MNHPFNKNFDHSQPASSGGETAAAGKGGAAKAGAWAAIIQGVGEGVSTGLNAKAQAAQGKLSAKEKKRRTLSMMLNNAIKRKSELHESKESHGSEMAGTKAQSLQNAARGFVNALGSRKK